MAAAPNRNAAGSASSGLDDPSCTPIYKDCNCDFNNPDDGSDERRASLQFRAVRYGFPAASHKIPCLWPVGTQKREPNPALGTKYGQTFPAVRESGTLSRIAGEGCSPKPQAWFAL
jgi:hypothetical protein